MANRFEAMQEDKTAKVKTGGFEWSHRCQAVGCSLKPSAIRNGYQLCTFHNGKNEGVGYTHWKAISEAIKNNMHLVKKTFGLSFKPAAFWEENKAQLLGWDFLPMQPNEWPNQYTARLLRKVENLIYEEASQALEHGTVGETKVKRKKPEGVKSIVEMAEQMEKERNG